jgi:hypothetical protein
MLIPATVALIRYAAQSGRSLILLSGVCATPKHVIQASTIYDFRTMPSSVMRATMKKGVARAFKLLDNRRHDGQDGTRDEGCRRRW